MTKRGASDDDDLRRRAERKTEMRAWQASHRGGEILCRLGSNRVELEGHCVFYLEGRAEI